MSLNVIKRFFSILLALFVLATALVSVLAIWKVIDIDDILSKSLTSLLVIFVSSAIILFIFTVLYPETPKKPPFPPQNL